MFKSAIIYLLIFKIIMPVASLTPASFQLTPHGANPWNVGKAKRSIATYSDRTRIKLNVVENQNDTYRYNVEDYSWQKYNTNEKQYVKQFKKYGIIYKTSVLTDEEFNTVKTELSNLSLDVIQETTSSVAHNRMGAQLPSDCEIIKMLSSTEGSFTKIINEIAGNCNDDRKMELSRIVPVEMRTYEQRGAGMEWHFDDVLYEPEQVEVVLTVENNSDCVTSWEEVQSNSEEIKLKQIETQPNSAIILKAGPSGARHSVSALKNGKRVILKFVFIRENAKFLEGAENHAKQFVSKKKNGPRKKKRKR